MNGPVARVVGVIGIALVALIAVGMGASLRLAVRKRYSSLAKMWAGIAVGVLLWSEIVPNVYNHAYG